ncbi:PspC domain-containing protein [Trujillonella humicola]|uniref:PspC domain-containing protein n=1 Tax=Trujillonella humicola TaxID=3383699 RepID=UPI003906CBEE
MTSTVPPTAPHDDRPPAAPAGPRLQRGRTDTMLGGVCRGLADATGIDVVLWRVGFLVLALTGAGLLVYPLLWVVLPAAPLPAGASPAPLDPFVERLHVRLTGALSGSRRR